MFEACFFASNWRFSVLNNGSYPNAAPVDSKMLRGSLTFVIMDS